MNDVDPGDRNGTGSGIGMALARAGFVLTGAGVAAPGVWLIVSGLPPRTWLGIMTWLVAAVVLHDGVFVPLAELARHGLARLPLGLASRTLLATVFAFAVVSTLVLAPEIRAQAAGARNPTILAGDYGLVLVLVWSAAGFVLLGTFAPGIVRGARRGRRSGPPASTSVR